MSVTQQLQLFVDVVQQGSFTKAAARNEMDNSALSKQIKKLEHHLGVKLLNRSTRSFSLTPVGEAILEQAKQLQVTLGRIQHIADAYQSEPVGRLRITSGVFFGQQYLQPVISRFLKRYPQVELTLSVDDKRNDIIGEQFDLAFRIGRLEESNMVAKKIADTHIALVASQEFFARYGRPKTPEELIQLPAIIYSNGDVTLDQLRIGQEPHGAQIQALKMRGNYKTGDVRSLAQAVRDGLGYAMMAVFNLDRPASELGLDTLLTDYRLSTMDSGIFAIYPHRQTTPLVQEFVKAVIEHLGTPPFWLNHIEDYDTLYR